MARFSDVPKDWEAVIKDINPAELTCEQSVDIIAFAVDQADERSVSVDVLWYCSDGLLELVLRRLLAQSLWCAVGKTLKRCCNERLLRWATEEATNRADGSEIVQYILPHCADDQLDAVLVQAVKRGHWQVVTKVVRKLVRIDQSTYFYLDKREARADAETKIWNEKVLPLCPRHTLDYLLTEVVIRGMWRGMRMVLEQDGCSEANRIWAIKEAAKRAEASSLYHIVHICPRDHFCWFLFKVIERGFIGVADCCLCYFGLGLCLSDVLRNYLKERTLRKAKTRGQDILSEASKDNLLEILNEITEHLQNVSKSRYAKCSQNGIIPESKLKEWVWKLEQRVVSNSLSLFQFKTLITCFYEIYMGGVSDEMLYVVLCSVPISIDIQSGLLKSRLQSTSLNFMSDSKIQAVWECIRYADLTYVWEQVRRDLFQAAVEQRQWRAVKQWADHSLYDDQRGWALGEAFKEKQWDVLLQLADHGLTKSELMGVYYRLARYGDWDTILDMFQRGADVKEVREMLETAVRRKRKRYHASEHVEDAHRCVSMKRLEKQIAACHTSFEVLAKRSNWRSVLYRIAHQPDEKEFNLALNTAIDKEAWHVVQQLVKLGMDTEQRDSLFTDMVRRKRWNVCRELLEHGVKVDLCLAALRELMKMNQWLLVAKVMEHDVDDAVRHWVMQSAIDKRQGSVVWHCIRLVQRRLTRAERKALFKKFMAEEVWQAVKPLIEETDQTGIFQRDAALQKAMKHHRWDVVDHCQRHKADINQKDCRLETALNRAARREDWKQVEQIVRRGGDQAILDRNGYSVLQRALCCGSWNNYCKENVIKVLIQYHGDVNEIGEDGEYSTDSDFGDEKDDGHFRDESPLDVMIARNMGELLDETLFWGCEVRDGVGSSGETALHAACASGCFKAMYYLVARGVDPLIVTMFGDSALLYATRRDKRVVAECIKLGFSTHQPIIDRAFERPAYDYRDEDMSTHISSPMEYAIVHNLPVIAHMLYESGACSYRELFRLYNFLCDADFEMLRDSYGGFVVDLDFNDVDDYETTIIQQNIEESLPYLQRVASTPRSLVSMCRHVISHCLNVHGKRHIDVHTLPLPDCLKDYVMFTDLTDPDYGKDITW